VIESILKAKNPNFATNLSDFFFIPKNSTASGFFGVFQAGFLGGVMGGFFFFWGGVFNANPD
jgi:hypothetical protein